MIKLTVTSFNGMPVTPPLAASFDETGGDIGRADTNLLVLPDPERTISRVQARVAFRSGDYALLNQGRTAISVNGRPVDEGREATIRIGDQIQIGTYVMRVEGASSAGTAIDPFADFGGLIQQQRPASSPTAVASPAPVQSMGIPDDWDPFATTPTASLARQGIAANPGARALGLDLGAGAATPLIPDLPAAHAADSIDQLFGLGSSAAMPADPLAHTPLAQPAAQPNMAAHSDPLKSLVSLTPGSAQSAPDRTSELNAPFVAPPAVSSAVSPAASPRPVQALPPGAAVFSWGDGAGDGRTIIRAGARHELPVPVSPQPNAPPPANGPQPVAPTPAVPAVPPGPLANADDAALLAAFREGLGMPELPIPELTPDLMRLVGQLLHESARGTVDLLVARAALKREVRAQVTMIVAKENNPLKFSPTAEVALTHLLGAPTRGFMPPQQAMRDAYDDLRAHQLAFLAGMRAALEGLLGRFDPGTLEGRLTQKSMLASVLPAARKAQLWGVFQEQYQQIAQEVSDDFHQVFGREFLRAYEAQLDALKHDQG